MEEADGIKESAGDATQAAQFAQIMRRLDSIEERLKECRQLGQRQWTYSIGFGGVAIGAGMITSGVALSNCGVLIGGVGAFLLGFVAMLCSMMKKSKHRREG